MPEAGRLPIEDFDEDEEERLVEVDENLVEAYAKAQQDYTTSYADTEHLKRVRDYHKAQLLDALGNTTGTATVGGNRRLAVRVSTSNRIDTKRLRAEAPDLARLYEIESYNARVSLI